MNKTIKIGIPYIENIGEKTRLCSKIYDEDSVEVLYYEVEKEFGQFFDQSRCDAFLVGLINSCMFNNDNIVCEGPVTDQLLFQLKTYYIPVISQNFSDMNNISIEAPEIPPLISNANAVGTGNSGGIDSTFTMLRYKKTGLHAYDLTHTIFTNISTNDFDDKRVRSLFDKDVSLKKQASEYLGLTFISLYTNLFLFYKQPGIFNHYFAQQYCSAPIALAKLFRVYYFSSTWKPSDFSLSEKDIISSSRYDLFSLSTLSTSNLTFYSAGTECDREQKLDYILDNESNLNYSKLFLQTCSIEQSAGGKYKNSKLNCGYCNKCGRTIVQLYSKNLLDEFKNIIDTSHFYKNKAKFIGRILASDQKQFSSQAKAELKNSHLYPKFTNIYYFLYKIRYKLAKNQFLVRIYHRRKKDV